MLAVLLFHLNPIQFQAGFLGVDIFFVISGFVVTPLILQIFKEGGEIRQSLVAFYLKRTSRLLPSLAFTLLFFSIILILFGFVSDISRVIKQSIASLVFLGNLGAYFFSGLNYFAPNQNPFVHFWSLAVEGQIYIFIPLLLVLIQRFKKNKKSEFALKSIFALSIVCLISDYFLNTHPSVLSRFGVSSKDSFLYYYPIGRIWEFGIGSLAFLLSIRSRAGGAKFLVLNCAIAIPFLLSIEIESFEMRFLACYLTGLSLITKAFLRDNKSILRMMVWVGDRSYSIYLVHLPLIYLLKAHTTLYDQSNILFYTSGVVACVSFGALQYVWIERRFRYTFLTSHHSLRAISLIFFSAAILIALLTLFQQTKLISDIGFVNKDLHLVRAKNCIDTSKPFDSCKWMAPNEEGKILLIGDSQAMAYGDGLIPAASELDLSTVVVSRSGCPFGEITTDGNRELPCNSWQREVLNYAIASRPQIVIIANWSIGYTNPQLGWRKLVMHNGQLAKSRLEAGKIYETGLRKYIQALSQAQIKVIIVDDGPYLPNLDTRTLASFVINRKARTTNADALESIYLRSEASRINKRIALSYANVEIVDPFSFLCERGKCLISDNGQYLYYDSFHVSVYGSSLLKSVWKKAIEKTIN